MGLLTIKRTHRRGVSASQITLKTDSMETDTSNTAAPSVEVPRLVRACDACGKPVERLRSLPKVKCRECKLADKRAWGKAKRSGPGICVTCGTPVNRKRMSHKAKCKECQLANKRAWSKAQTLPVEELVKRRAANGKRIPRSKASEEKRLTALRTSSKAKEARRNLAAKYRHLAAAAAAASPLAGKFETNVHAERWCLRTPDRGQIYEFTNLAHFIRNHSHLFNPDDLVINRFGTCKAERGLAKLSPRRREVKGSWKGWQWVSTIERRVGNNDLLGANACSPNR